MIGQVLGMEGVGQEDAVHVVGHRLAAEVQHGRSDVGDFGALQFVARLELRPEGVENPIRP